MKYNFLARIRFVYVVIFISFFLVITRLFSVQVIHNREYADKADRQYVMPSESMFDRGSLFFTKNDGSLVGAATTVTGFKITINPKEIKDLESTYASLASIYEIDKDNFFKKASKKDDPYEEIANRLTKEDADKIKALKISGVHVFKEKWRFYPGNDLASQTIGFVAYKDNDFLGRYGLEKQYNNLLSFSQEKLYVNFFAEIFSSLNKVFFNNPKKEGDLAISIEPVVESFVGKELNSAVEKWRAERGGVIVLNPRTGEIYSMASFPTFNINNFSKVSEVSTFSNPLIENVFEFGSVIKPFTMSMGLNEGVVTAETKYNDLGFVVIEDKQINNFDKKARGVVSMQEILNQSLNTGAVFVMQKVGREKFKKYMINFGFTEKTNIDLPNEAKNLTNNLQSPRELEYANMSFGQGIAMSPISMVRAFSALSNGGYIITPHLGTDIKYRDGGREHLEYATGIQVLSKESSDKITNMLVTVVDKGFDDTKYNLQKYSIAAKTGTAQIAREDGGGYYEDKNLHSIIGYFPAYDPQFLVFYYLINPKAQYAIESLKEPFLNTTKFLLNYYKIPPDR